MGSAQERELECVPCFHTSLPAVLNNRLHLEILIAVVFFAAFTILLLVYQDQLVRALRPAAKWMHEYVRYLAHT
jgi:hypothetical protein